MFDDHDGDRRDFLKCMAWAGTGTLFAFNGGIGSSIALDSALAAPLKSGGTKPFTFQLSDSHIGFNKPPNADARATFREAIAKVKALPNRPDFIIHTGDVSQLSRDEEFDDAEHGSTVASTSRRRCPSSPTSAFRLPAAGSIRLAARPSRRSSTTGVCTR